MEFPSLVFRCPGEHFAHSGATYKYAAVKDQESLDKKISEGWYKSLGEAVDAFKNKSAPKPEINLVNENSAPTREEMEIKAKELGIKFDGRTNDAKLLKLINESM